MEWLLLPLEEWGWQMTPTMCHWTSVYTSCMPGVERSMSTHEWLGIIMVIENQAALWCVCLLPVYALVSGMYICCHNAYLGSPIVIIVSFTRHMLCNVVQWKLYVYMISLQSEHFVRLCCPWKKSSCSRPLHGTRPARLIDCNHWILC